MTAYCSEPNFPKKGWNCVDCDDLGAPEEICEYCGHQEIRYVHILKHPDFPRTIRVGSECADNLMLDYNSKKHERLAQQRYRFINSPRWKISKRGTPYINNNDFHINLKKQSNDLWSYSIAPKGTSTQATWINNFKSDIEAKKDAFNTMQYIKGVLRK